MRRIFPIRKSSWFRRSPYSVAVGITLTTAVAPPTKGRPSAGGQRRRRIYDGGLDDGTRNALERSRQLHVDSRDRVRRASLNCVRYGSLTRQYGLSGAALRKRRADLAVVGEPTARADAALRDHAAQDARSHSRSTPCQFSVCVAVILREGQVVVRRTREAGLGDVEQPAHRIYHRRRAAAHRWAR